MPIFVLLPKLLDMELFDFRSYFNLLINRETGRMKAKMLPLGDDIKRSLCATLKFYYCCLDGKDKYYIHIESGKLSLVNLNIINYSVFNYIKRYFEMSFDPFKSIYLEGLYSSSPSVFFKKSDLRKCCPYYSLWDEPRHQLKMLVDDAYYKLYKKEEVINYLEHNSFSFNKYKFEPRCHTDGFYYRKINDNDYLICSYAAYNNKTNIFIFDLFRCSYKRLTFSGVNYPQRKPEALLLGIDISKHKKGLDYVLSNPYATKSELYNVMRNV